MAFRNMEERLQNLGYDTVVPHDLDPGIDYDLEKILAPVDWKEYVWRKYMNACIPEVLSSKLIVTLEDWEYSRGSRIEVHNAREFIIPVFHFSTIIPAAEFETNYLTNVMKAL